MADNPYVPPEVEADSPPSVTRPPQNGVPRPQKWVVPMCCLFAVLCGLGFYISGPSQFPEGLIFFLAMWCPGFALLTAGVAGMFPTGQFNASEFGKIVAKVVLILLMGVAGYAAFLATCTYSTIGISSMNLPSWIARGDRYMGPPLVTGVMAFLSTLLGCVIVSLMASGVRRLAPKFFGDSKSE